MPTSWLFWLNVSSGALGVLIILYGAIARRNLRGKPLDVETRQLLILLGVYAVLMSIDMALTSSGWRFPFDSAVKWILAVISLVLLAVVINVVAYRRNHARAIAAQSAQSSTQTNEEVE
jgi:hypothetical protein